MCSEIHGDYRDVSLFIHVLGVWRTLSIRRLISFILRNLIVSLIDQCKDTESTDVILIYRVGKVQGHKTRYLLSRIYVKGFALLKNNQKHIIIILDINYTLDWGWKSCFKNRKGRKS